MPLVKRCAVAPTMPLSDVMQCTDSVQDNLTSASPSLSRSPSVYDVSWSQTVRIVQPLRTKLRFLSRTGHGRSRTRLRVSLLSSPGGEDCLSLAGGADDV